MPLVNQLSSLSQKDSISISAVQLPMPDDHSSKAGILVCLSRTATGEQRGTQLQEKQNGND
jgi:hypothetical protein